MKLSFFSLASVVGALVIGMTFPFNSDAESYREKGVHYKEGVKCIDCHGVEKPKEEPTSKACLDCHGPYSKIAERTRKLQANPHDSHMGPLDCLKCHGVHEPLELEQIPCMECHADFEFKPK